MILTIDGEEVPTEEFLYLYNKNNQQQNQPLTLEEYLQLFEVYRLKVAEAKSLGIDTTASFKNEIDIYRRELLEPYVTDTVFFNQLVDKAFERENTQVESSHIMIIRTHNEARDARNRALLDSIRTELLNGADFIEMAKEYSQDKFSAAKGGYLGFAPAGTYPYGFETAVYETPEGEISEIVESHVGWHIVKPGARKPSLDFNRKVKSYDEVKAEVSQKVTSPFDARYNQIRQNLIKKLSDRHKNIDLEGKSPEETYNVLMAAEEEIQYQSNPEYRNLVDEYTNGSLLYEVSVENIWNKASNDSVGLRNFYNKHIDNYNWDKPHAKGILVLAQNDSVAAEIKKQITGLNGNEAIDLIRSKFKRVASVERFNTPKGGNSLIDIAMFNEEKEKPNLRNFSTYFILEGRIIDQPENLEDVKSSVINDYQDKLEKDWVKDLRSRHKLEVNKKELDKIRKKIK
ncbi:MAG: peptidylprolyl isomerase [Muribaculaceae bacterium]|nr:peptidylprolyl isomerase [Muribaculaceae bacterium]